MTRSCVFCRVAAGELPGNIVHRDERVLAFLDASPLMLGHVLVVPIVHADTLDDLAPELVGPLFEVVRRMSIAVQRALGADGSFVAINTRTSQSVPHVHVHVVPRSQGDGLFSPRPIWKRRSYADDAEAAEYARKLRAAYADVAADR
ncbi:MAG TPA: HIT domain-containing protein [Candidatus Limnocylindria bacterium]